jgi:hypothetical protein
MNKFKTWYVNNQDAITWFVIGWMAQAGLHNFSTGDYVWAGICFVIAYLNYAMRRVRLS